MSRRLVIGAAAAAIAVQPALAQTRQQIEAGEHNHSSGNPGPNNKLLASENKDSENPPPTDKGDVKPFWYSFDLAHRRIQDGGWTRQVTQRDLPESKDLAGVSMRLTAGSYRELHWHTANEWSYMTNGHARVTCLNPDGTIFIDDVSEGDLWYFSAGYPHSIQGLGPDGCEFLLIFDQGDFSEYETFLISDWVAHTPPDVLEKNLRLPSTDIKKLPKEELYIFPGTVPGSLEEDRAAVGGKSVESKVTYTFSMKAMKPKLETEGGTVRVVDSTVFAASKTVAAALVTLTPGALRELHWHPNASEWQYYLAGSGRMTIFVAAGKARTMNFNANDVGFIPAVAGHYIENTGKEDLVFLEIFKSSYYADYSLNQWIGRLPKLIAKEHLKLDEGAIARIPAAKNVVVRQRDLG